MSPVCNNFVVAQNTPKQQYTHLDGETKISPNLVLSLIEGRADTVANFTPGENIFYYRNIATTKQKNKKLL